MFIIPLIGKSKSRLLGLGLGACIMKNLVEINVMIDNQLAFFLFVPRSILQWEMTKLIIILIIAI